MGFFSNLFKKKEKEVVVQTQPIEQQETNGDIICEYCKRSIFGEQRVKTFNGKKFHVKPCWFQLRKDAQAYASGEVSIANK